MLRLTINGTAIFRVVALCFVCYGTAGCAGGTGLGVDLVSTAQVETMGLETWQAIREQTKASDNRKFQQVAQEVARNVLSAAGENPSAWEIVVFQGDEVNAFALPGRKIGVYEGMFRIADTPDQLAAIIGHEIGHVEQHHSAERVNTQAGTQLGTELIARALGAANVAPPETVAQIVGTGLTYGVVLPYSRNQELEADEIGLRYMVRAGYNPRAAVELWREMGAMGNRQPEFLSTHPDPERRMAALEAMVNKLEER